MGKLGHMRRQTGQLGRSVSVGFAVPFLVVAALALAACGRPGPENGQAQSEPETVDETAGPSLDAGEVADNTQTGQIITGRAGVRIVSDGPILTPLPPTTPPTTAAPQSQLYEVQPGDTLSVIAERFGISTTALADANGITDVNTIKPGQELTIPPPS